MTAYRFEIPGHPVAKGRPRFSARGGIARAYTPAKTARAEQDVALLAAKYAPRAPHDGPVDLRIGFYLPIPRSWSATKRLAAADQRLRPTARPDLDNYAKLVMDALSRSGRWWGDDSQVVTLTAWKLFAAEPYTYVEVTFL